MDHTILYKFAKRLNRPYSRYKTAAESPKDCNTTETSDSSQTAINGSEPLYQEIDNFRGKKRVVGHFNPNNTETNYVYIAVVFLPK